MELTDKINHGTILSIYDWSTFQCRVISTLELAPGANSMKNLITEIPRILEINPANEIYTNYLTGII